MALVFALGLLPPTVSMQVDQLHLQIIGLLALKQTLRILEAMQFKLLPQLFLSNLILNYQLYRQHL